MQSSRSFLCYFCKARDVEREQDGGEFDGGIV